MNGTTPRPATRRGDLAVVMICEWCGKQIRLVVGDFGPELEDSDEFLVAHAMCLRQHPIPVPRSPN